MKSRRNKCGVYQYLDRLGLLEKGSEDAIAAAKKEYWKQYKYAWLKNKRMNKALTIYLNDAEFALTNKYAHMHKRSNTRYVKDSAMAYMRQTFLVPDPIAVNVIKGLLTQILSQLKIVATDKRLSYREVEDQLKHILALEAEILESLVNAKKISDGH